MTDARGGAPFFGLTAKQIYDQVTGGPGSTQLADAQAAARDEFEREAARAARIQQIANKTADGWQGEAGAAAHGAAGPLADGARQGAEHLGFTQQLHANEVEVFHSVKNAVVPVPEHPPEPNILTQKYPWMEDFDQDVQNYQAAVQHNQDTFRVYDQTGMQYESALAARQYPAVNQSGGDITVTSSSSSNGTIDSADYRTTNSTGAGPGGMPSPVGSDSPTPSSRPPAPGGVPAPSGGDATGSSNVPAGTTSSASHVTPSTPTPSTSPGTPSTTTGTPGGLVGAGPAVGAAPPGSGTGTGVGRGSGVGGLGQRGASLAGPGVRGGLPGGAVPSGPGAGAGTAPGGGPAGTAGAAGAAGARGAGMAGMPMGAGGGRGKGDDENEHERKYLQPVDAEGTFGNEELTPPQVIGDPAYEDQ